MKTLKPFHTTTFQLTHNLQTQLKMMCVLTGVSMGEFIRIAIRDKIIELKKSNIGIEN